MKFAVVIPAHCSNSQIQRCLQSICSSTLLPEQIIVVDDGSPAPLSTTIDGPPVKFVRLKKKHGPALARNIGFHQTQEEIVFFLDSDVRVNTMTFEKAIQAFINEQLQALVGVLDHNHFDSFFGEYKNLWMKFTYESSPRESGLFYTGICSIRREVFLESGGFDTNYKSPSVEDNELGNRLLEKNVRPIIKKSVLVFHDKNYSLFSLIKTDFLRSKALLKLMLRNWIKSKKPWIKKEQTSIPAGYMLGAITLVLSVLISLYFTNPFPFIGGLIFSILFNAQFLYWVNKQRGSRMALLSASWTPFGQILAILGPLVGGIEFILGRRY